MADTNGSIDKPTVLIVDDSPNDIALISELLKGLYKIKIAGNGEQALKIARTDKPPDLILLDIMMPVMDGYETCLRLKDNPKTLNIPVIFLTSKTELDDELKGFALGAVDYITKPISPPILLARVQTHLQLKRVRDYLKDKNAFLEDEVNRRIQMITQAKRDWERTFDAVPDLIMLLDKDHRILRTNRAMAEQFGKTFQELVGQHCYEVVHGLSAPPGVCPHTRLLKSTQEERSEFMEEGLGKFLDVRTTPLYRDDGQLKGSVHVVRDITERKQAEHQIKERMKELQAFYTLSKLISRENITTDEFFQEFCNFLPNSWQYPEITGIRIVIGNKEYCTNNFMESAWMLSANIIRCYEIYGHIDVVYLEARPEIDEGPFMKEERMLIDSLSERLGRLVERNRAEKQLKDTLENLKKAMGTTIQALVLTVEARDPYTSGHQIRSAELACAIASEMGLPQDKIDGLRMAGSIHDIGKISIPAEILTKPTKLSELEFSMIKEHARRGYELLKNIESAWPLAEIVYQHHERIDGSGYPRNLKGEKILIEARILAIADVVEAMASHRPYRVGLGIDAALNEIEKNEGIFYDTAVADACLKLFREKGFKLDGA